jgi:hypothetical protein
MNQHFSSPSLLDPEIWFEDEEPEETKRIEEKKKRQKEIDKAQRKPTRPANAGSDAVAGAQSPRLTSPSPHLKTNRNIPSAPTR